MIQSSSSMTQQSVELYEIAIPPEEKHKVIL
jgi:uncharacterized protein (DUF2249 family)